MCSRTVQVLYLCVLYVHVYSHAISKLTVFISLPSMHMNSRLINTVFYTCILYGVYFVNMSTFTHLCIFIPAY